MKNKLVSIIMPAYNSENYVSEAIESVCKQSYKNWELLIVNDGSTDQTSNILNDYAQKDSRIKVFHRNNQGVSAARNYALDQISGEYVTFIDSDDAYHRDRLQKMLQIFEEHDDVQIVFARHLEFSGTLEERYECTSSKQVFQGSDIIKDIISDSNNHFVWNAMIQSGITKK